MVAFLNVQSPTRRWHNSQYSTSVTLPLSFPLAVEIAVDADDEAAL